jgi:hypothetical protein
MVIEKFFLLQVSSYKRELPRSFEAGVRLRQALL